MNAPLILPVQLAQLQVNDGTIHVHLDLRQILQHLRSGGHLANQPLPAKLDIEQILVDFRRAGWLDQKIETACSLSNGYVAQLRTGRIERMSFEYGARLYNLWLDEQPHLSALTLAATTT